MGANKLRSQIRASQSGFSIALILLISVSRLGVEAQQPSEPPKYIIRDVRVFDGYRVLPHRTVLVADGRIVSVLPKAFATAPLGYQVINGAGMTLLPGLIDAHVHISPQFTREALQQELRFGVTTVLDMYTGSEGIQAFKQARERNAFDEADFRMAGSGATVPGGHPTELSSKGQIPLPTITDPADAQTFVDARIREGSEYLKIIFDDGHAFDTPEIHYSIMSVELLKALVQAAHARGLIAVVHIESEDQAREALRAGADGLAHTPIGASLSSDFGEFVKAHHAFVISTLTTDHWFCGDSRGKALLADPELGPYVLPQFRGGLGLPLYLKHPASCVAADESIGQYKRSGVRLLLGTDSPVPGTTYGISMYDELHRAVEDGLSPIEALRDATNTASGTFGLRDRGKVKPGARADLLLVRGDPTSTITDIRHIVAVWKRGSLVSGDRFAAQTIVSGTN